MDKLNALAARAVGWEWLRDPEIDGWFWYYPNGNLAKTKSEWHPATCADDALTLLDKVTGGEWTLASYHPPESGDIEFDCYTITIQAGANTAPLAMTLCALRAAGIPESEITAAME